MEKMFIIKKGVLKKQKGFFLSYHSLMITVWLVVVVVLFAVIDSFANYVGRILHEVQWLF